MSIRDARRQAALERMADHVLEVGLRGASLRPMAAAAGTTSRMLLYYFADKDDLLDATLGLVADRLKGLLEESLTEPAPFDELLPTIWRAMKGPTIRPHMRLWLELAALAARDEEPFRVIAGRIADGFLAWAGARLLVDREEDRGPTAALLLCTVDGLFLLEAVGRPAEADAAIATRRGPPTDRGSAIPRG